MKHSKDRNREMVRAPGDGTVMVADRSEDPVFNRGAAVRIVAESSTDRTSQQHGRPYPPVGTTELASSRSGRVATAGGDAIAVLRSM